MIASLLVLGVLSLGAANLLYFTLIAGAGASRAILVNYLVPPVALVYGAIFLGESIALSALAGLALILAGTMLGAGPVPDRSQSDAGGGRIAVD